MYGFHIGWFEAHFSLHNTSQKVCTWQRAHSLALPWLQFDLCFPYYIQVLTLCLWVLTNGSRARGRWRWGLIMGAPGGGGWLQTCLNFLFFLNSVSSSDAQMKVQFLRHLICSMCSLFTVAHTTCAALILYCELPRCLVQLFHYSLFINLYILHLVPFIFSPILPSSFSNFSVWVIF